MPTIALARLIFGLLQPFVWKIRFKGPGKELFLNQLDLFSALFYFLPNNC
jgi:hypothetical protein